MKRALIFSPYLDSLGGGEIYTLTIAECLKKQDYQIEIAWKDTNLWPLYKQRFNLELSGYELSPQMYRLFTQKQSLYQIYSQTKNYDLIFFLSDGSIPFLFGKKNLIHFQVPFTHLKSNLTTKIKLLNTELVCNSQFTQKIINQQLHTSSLVLYPPVEQKKPLKKKKQILNVGRFTATLQNKRQDLMIEVFKQMVDEGLKSWKLVLLGNTAEKESQKYVAKLKTLVKDYPIEIITDADYSQLNQAYGEASIYWHATGFDLDEAQQPEKVEHFGISTVEAMSAGAIPIVINKGGQKEIVEEGKTGFLFNSKEELLSKTLKLINSNQSKFKKLQSSARKKASEFSREQFCQKVEVLV